MLEIDGRYKINLDEFEHKSIVEKLLDKDCEYIYINEGCLSRPRKITHISICSKNEITGTHECIFAEYKEFMGTEIRRCFIEDIGITWSFENDFKNVIY